MGQQLCTTFDTNVQNCLEQLSENDATISEWQLTNESLHLVYFCKPLFWKKVFMMCVVTAQFQQRLSFIIYVSITMSANHTPPYPGIVPNMCSEEVFQTLTTSTWACTPFATEGSIYSIHLHSPLSGISRNPLQPGQTVLAQHRSGRVITYFRNAHC